MLLGSVKVWDPRQKDKPVANMTPAEGEEGRDCWCVAFGETFSLSYLIVLRKKDESEGKRKEKSVCIT